MTVIGSNAIIHKRIESTEMFVPLTPSATSYGMGWKTLRAVHYRGSAASGEFSLPPVSRHQLFLIIQPSERLELRSEGVKLDRPPAAGSIHVIPAGSSVRWRREGSRNSLLIDLEPSLIARVAAEAFELDSSRTMLPPLYGLNVPELRSAMLAVDAELMAGGVGGSLLAESFANVLAVHLIRHIKGPGRLKAAAERVLPGHKVRRVVEYIMENLENNPTLEQMARIVHLSSYHFARLFKAATGLAPHQFVITRRIERAQHLLRTNGELGLAEVAFRSGFANQSHFSLHFKRIVGVTPRRFRETANGRPMLESSGSRG
ncbi:MAG TPA: AraC family transcriptional regulator [Chthoniobacterales bacterium]|nr:AraC family transcriptional regulator [Chthoniobacterales bacterium]